MSEIISEITIKEIWDELRAAMITLARLPMGKGARPSMQMAWWPDFHRFMSDSYADEKTRIRLVASSQSIDRLDIVLSWLIAIPDVINRKIVIMRAIGLSYPKIAKILERDAKFLGKRANQKTLWIKHLSDLRSHFKKK